MGNMVNFVKMLVISMKLPIEYEVTRDIKRKVADAITKLIHFGFLYDSIFF